MADNGKEKQDLKVDPSDEDIFDDISVEVCDDTTFTDLCNDKRYFETVIECNFRSDRLKQEPSRFIRGAIVKAAEQANDKSLLYICTGMKSITLVTKSREAAAPYVDLAAKMIRELKSEKSKRLYITGTQACNRQRLKTIMEQYGKVHFIKMLTGSLPMEFMAYGAIVALEPRKRIPISIKYQCRGETYELKIKLAKKRAPEQKPRQYSGYAAVLVGGGQHDARNSDPRANDALQQPNMKDQAREEDPKKGAVDQAQAEARTSPCE